MKRSWADFHVEPIEAEDEEDYVPGAKHPHRRAIWRGIDLTTMYNDEVHGVKNDNQQTRTTEGTSTGT